MSYPKYSGHGKIERKKTCIKKNKGSKKRR